MKSGFRRFVYSFAACLCLVTGGALEAQTSITSGTPPNGTVGTPYGFTFTAEGPNCSSEPTFFWSATGLPPWLVLNSETGQIAGTPPTAGPVIFTITASDNSCEDQTAQHQYTITISPSSSPSEIIYVLNANDENASIIAFPGGASLYCSDYSDGLCNDFPDDFATDSAGNFILAVGGGILKMTPSGAVSTLATASEGSDFFSVALDASGNYIVADDGLHAVWWIPAGGGTPALVGNYTPASSGEDVVVRVDASGHYIVVEDGGGSGTQFYNFAPYTPAQVSPQTPSGLIDGTIFPGYYVGGMTFNAGGNYVITLDGDDGQTPIVETVTTTGSFSTLYSNSDGPLSDPLGIFRDPVTGNFLIVDDDTDQLYQLASNGSSISQINTGTSLSDPIAVLAVLQVTAPPTTPPTAPPLQLSGPGNLGEIVFGKPVSAGFSASGGTPPYTFSAVNLPPGMKLSGSSLSGTPAAPGVYNFQINVNDSGGQTAYTLVSLSVFGLTGGALPPAVAYAPYSTRVSAAGGVQPYSYTGTGAPAGITISQTGSIGGVTTKTGSFSLSITATDENGLQSTATYTLSVVVPPALTVQGGTLSSVTVRTPSSQTLTATGGAPPYTWAVAAGTLPPGLTLQSFGTLNGVSSKYGTFGFTVRVTDSAGASADGSFSMVIVPQPLTVLAPSPLASGMATVDYPDQTVSASGGVPPYQFTVPAGSLPAGLSLAPTGDITGTPTNAGISSVTVTASDSSTPPLIGTATFSINIRPFSPDLILSSGSVSFSLAAGAAILPASQTVQVEATDVTQILGYSVAISPASATWLGISSPGGKTPGSFSISLTSAALPLAASTTPYQASVVVTCTTGPCAGKTQTVGVSLTVTALPPQLTLIEDFLTFNTLSSSPQVTTQTLGLENGGGGTIGFALVACGAPWCTVSGVPSSIGAGATALLNVTADPTGLTAGYYWTDISILSSAGSAIVPVTFLIAANGTLTLAPAGAEFTLPQGGAAVGDTSILVSISGSAAVSFSAQVSPGAPWLSVTPTSGTASGTQPADLNLVFDPVQVAALSAGTYYATVQVSSSGAVNSPRSFEVVLNVTAPTQRTKPDPVPGGLIFLTQATNTPPAQTIALFSGSPTAIGYQASVATNNGGNWLSVSPATATTSSAAPAQSSVSVNPSGLKPGVYTGTVSYAFSASAVRSLNVTLVVEAPVSVSTTSQIGARGEQPAQVSGCSPTQIIPTSTALVGNFAAPAAWPIELAVQLVDDCGSPIANGQVVATFSNADPPLVLSLANAATGLYDATWTPQHTAAQVVINARATAPGLPAATQQIAGAVTGNNAPILAHNSIANFYNPVGGAPLAPGTLVQITGQYLAGQTLADATVPVPLTLGGTSVIIGGIQAPVSFVSPGQIFAQVPFELPAGQPYQVIVNANGSLTTPDSFEAGSASPGLSVLPSGYVQANHQDGTVVSDSSPAKPGEYIAVYLVGMGPTTIPVGSGAPGPGSPFANTVNPPSITLNNEPTSFIFSGLIPGLVGVYQVNLQIPLDAANGDPILSFSETGVNSNAGILPVHN